MPWLKHFTDESHPKVYLNLIDALLEHMSSEKEVIIRGLYVRTVLLKFDLTKRQRAIVNFIFSSSYLYGKRTALIPRTKDWEICGIQHSKVLGELSKLEDMKVITWDKETNEFGIADPRGWKVPENHGWNQTRARELFVLNLKHAGIDADSIIKMSLKESDNF